MEVFFIFIFIFILVVLSLHCCEGFSVVATSGACSLVWCAGFSLRWPLVTEHGLFGLWASVFVTRWLRFRILGSKAQAQ